MILFYGFFSLSKIYFKYNQFEFAEKCVFDV